MPSYNWTCTCGHNTEVVRKMADIDLAPDNGCDKCGSKELKRTIAIDPKVKNFVLRGETGWHHTDYTKHGSRN
jgi:putative FmdB family regulatory protein